MGAINVKTMREVMDDPNLNFETLEDGHIVSQRVVRLIELIHDTYNGRVEVRWIPPNQKGKDQYQFCILEVLPDGQEFIIMWVKNEQEFTGEVLEKLFLADNTKTNVLTEMDARNEAIKAVRRKVYEEQMAEAHDIAKHILVSPLNKYTVSKDIVIRDHGNRIR